MEKNSRIPLPQEVLDNGYTWEIIDGNNYYGNLYDSKGGIAGRYVTRREASSIAKANIRGSIQETMQPQPTIIQNYAEGYLEGWITLLCEALAAAHFYIAASDRELDIKGMTRGDALEDFYRKHDAALAKKEKSHG